ncbi:MAG: hypothetical protein AAGH92_04855 [Planctomycetota bacterium]
MYLEGSWLQMRWARRLGSNFNQALKDWALIIEEAISSDDPEGQLWSTGQAPDVRWIASKQINGFASIRDEGRAKISTTLGLYTRVHEFAYRIFSVTDLVPSIGEPAREAGTLAQRARDRRWVRSPEEPACPFRRYACFLLAECAIAFVFYHEAGHLILGHCGDGSTASSLQERTAFRRKTSGRKDAEPDLSAARASQLQELQADRLALATQMHHLRRGGGVFPGQHVDEELRQAMPKIVSLSQVALHIALCDRLRPVSAFDTAPHPHPLTRYIDSIGSLHRGGLVSEKDDVSYVGDAFRLASAMLRQNFTDRHFDALASEARLQHDAIHQTAVDA